MTDAVRILIAEDEAPQRRELIRLLAQQWPEANLVAECSDGLQALDAIEQHQPDVVFLDIRMPGISGIAVAKAASGRCHVVFTTAFDHYAVEAFETGAVDYLLKPIEAGRLRQSVERLRQRLVSQAPGDISETLARLEDQLTPNRAGLKWITASVGDAIKMIAIDDVLFFQAEQKYVRVVTADTEAIIRLSLKALIEQLDSQQFWQIHRGTVVAASAIDRVTKDELGKWWLQVKDCAEQLAVSSTYQPRFRGM